MPEANAILDLLSPGLRALAPVETARVDARLHRLQWNESPFDFPADLKEEVLQRLMRMEWARYPTALRPFDLIDALARHTGLPAAQIVVSGGSADLIRLTLAALIQPGDAVVMPSPTFLLYKRTARALEADIHEISLDPAQDFALPVDDLIVTAQTNGAKAVVLCAPNNPTGTVYSLGELRALAQDCGGALVIDEAYCHFSGQDLRPLPAEHPNVILLRTFSKAYSMAGVRVGYALADAAVVAELQKAVAPFPISVFSEIAALVALENHARFLAQVAQVVAERERLAAALAALPGLRVYSSGANFLLVRTESAPAEAIFGHLLHERGVLVNDAGSYPELDNCLRVTVGTPEQNEIVIAGFKAATRTA